MSFYTESITKILQEKIAYFNNSGLSKEAALLKTRLNALEIKPSKTFENVLPQIQAQNSILESAKENLMAKLTAQTRHIPEIEKQYILERAGNAKSLKELGQLRVAYINRLLKISRAASSKNIELNSAKDATGPYNNEKTFSEALRLIYSQDPLWIEDLKELYFSVMPLNSLK